VQQICECPAGLFWYDCSLGCSGLTTLSTTNGTFAVGGGRRPLPVGVSGCEWLIAPTSPLTSITVSFDYFDISSTDYVDVYTGSDLIASLSGPQILQPITLNTTSVYVKLRMAYGSQGYSGFQASWSSFFLKVNQVLIISAFHPAAIVFYVLMGLGIALFISLLVFLARYKSTPAIGISKHFLHKFLTFLCRLLDYAIIKCIFSCSGRLWSRPWLLSDSSILGRAISWSLCAALLVSIFRMDNHDGMLLGEELEDSQNFQQQENEACDPY
jgi:hypothetical protein